MLRCRQIARHKATSAIHCTKRRKKRTAREVVVDHVVTSTTLVVHKKRRVRITICRDLHPIGWVQTLKIDDGVHYVHLKSQTRRDSRRYHVVYHPPVSGEFAPKLCILLQERGR